MAVEDGGATLLPIDSEHNAIFQCLPPVRRASGPRGVAASCSPRRAARSARGPGELAAVTPGRGLRASQLGDGPQDLGRFGDDDEQGAGSDRGALAVRRGRERIEVVIHPQSVIHSLVEYVDGSVLAQLGNPDMRTPIAQALAYPERIDAGVPPLDLAQLAGLSFEEPDRALPVPGPGLCGLAAGGRRRQF